MKKILLLSIILLSIKLNANIITDDQKLCEQGDAVACVNQGYRYSIGGGVKLNYKLALKYNKIGCEQGNSIGCSNVAVFYRDGIGVSKNQKKAIDWVKKACDKGGIESCHELGQIYERGEGVQQDFSKAIRFYVR